MTSPESIRLDLYNGLQELLGTDRATYLMTHLLPAEMPDLLTTSEFGVEMSQVKTEISQVKTEMSQVKTELSQIKTEVSRVKKELSDLDTRFMKLEDKLDTKFAEVNKRIDRVLLAVVGGLFVMIAAMSGIAAAVINTIS
jgi:DNA repair ATPase RecN